MENSRQKLSYKLIVPQKITYLERKAPGLLLFLECEKRNSTDGETDKVIAIYSNNPAHGCRSGSGK